MKIKKQTDSYSRQSKIRQKLRFMNGQYLFNTLYFNYDSPVSDDIYSIIAIELNSFILQR